MFIAYSPTPQPTIHIWLHIVTGTRHRSWQNRTANRDTGIEREITKNGGLGVDARFVSIIPGVGIMFYYFKSENDDKSHPSRWQNDTDCKSFNITTKNRIAVRFLSPADYFFFPFGNFTIGTAWKVYYVFIGKKYICFKLK